MATIAHPAHRAHPVHTRTGDDALGDLAEALVPVAARLVAVVHDEGPDAVTAALAAVPAGRLDALCVVLAAMVDPDGRPSELLAWTRFTPAQHAERERLVAAGVRTRAADVIAAQLGARPTRAA